MGEPDMMILCTVASCFATSVICINAPFSGDTLQLVGASTDRKTYRIRLHHVMLAL